MAHLLHQVLDDAADHAPDSEALRFEGRILCYQALAGRANQTARALIALGVTPGDRIGIYLTKGFDAVVAMYGIWKAGAAYVPLDPWLPPARLAQLVFDCGIGVVFTDPLRQRTLAAANPSANTELQVIGVPPDPEGRWHATSWRDVGQQPTTAPDVAGADRDLAYIFYTSGSTGEPKGMMHTHRSGLSFCGMGHRRVRATENRPGRQPCAAPLRSVSL